MQAAGCKFCDIVKHKLPASFVFTSPGVVAFMDAFPISYGHVLVVPTTHYSSIFEVPEELVGQSFKLARRICLAAKLALTDVNGINILQNNGDSAGQRIPHFHIHVIPRAKTAGEETRWTPIRKQAERRLLDEMAAKIKAQLLRIDEESPHE